MHPLKVIDIMGVPTPLVILETRNSGVTAEVGRFRENPLGTAIEFWATVSAYMSVTALTDPDEFVIRILRPQQE